jgi:hypothetical protein
MADNGKSKDAYGKVNHENVKGGGGSVPRKGGLSNQLNSKGAKSLSQVGLIMSKASPSTANHPKDPARNLQGNTSGGAKIKRAGGGGGRGPTLRGGIGG